MAEIKCPTCGAGIDSDGKFCKFCGTKLPDNTQHIEVSGTIDHNVNIRKENINQARIARIEQRANVKKAKMQLAAIRERERQEELIRLQEEKRKNDAMTLKFIVIMIGFVALLYVLFMNRP